MQYSITPPHFNLQPLHIETDVSSTDHMSHEFESLDCHEFLSEAEKLL